MTTYLLKLPVTLMARLYEHKSKTGIPIAVAIRKAIELYLDSLES